MNLPHLPSLKFAQEILTCKEGRATVFCEFPCVPTLPMFTEAAAQASCAFATSDTPQNGFLVLIKEATLHVKAQSLTCVVVIESHVSLGNSSEFNFEVFEKEGGAMYASGLLMIVREDRGI